jgi:hypothetical protein
LNAVASPSARRGAKAKGVKFGRKPALTSHQQQEARKITSLSETQLEKILSAINALHSDGWWQWVPVASVFVSAFLAMIVGIALEMYRNSRSVKKGAREKLEKEVSQINVAISGVSYNIEVLLHVVSDFLIPHHSKSHIVFTALQEAQDDPQKLQQVASSFSDPNYRALRKTCPELQFIEWDFFKEVPFIAEKDPELLKNTGWVRGQSREINTTIKNHNAHLMGAMQTTMHQGGLITSQLYSILHLQTSLADAECLTALQLFDKLLDMEKRLEAINDTYEIDVRKTKITTPKSLGPVLEQLREIEKTHRS